MALFTDFYGRFVLLIFSESNNESIDYEQDEGHQYHTYLRLSFYKAVELPLHNKLIAHRVLQILSDPDVLLDPRLLRSTIG